MAKIERKLKEILNKERTVTSVADEFKVSRQTVYKWLEVYEKKGAKGFAYKKIKGGIFAAEALPKNNLDTNPKIEKSLDTPLAITEPLIDTWIPDVTSLVSVVPDTVPVVTHISPEPLVVTPLVVTSVLSAPDKIESTLPSPASPYLRNQNTFFLVVQHLKTSAFMALVAVIAFVSSFFIGAHDVAQFATLSVPTSAESTIQPTSILSSISVKVYCGVNYFMTSSETWKCKEKAVSPSLAKTDSMPLEEASKASSFTAPSVITREVIKYIPSPVKIVKEKEAAPNIVNNYITKYVSVPGPKGDTGAPGAMGPAGSYSYVPVLTSLVSSASVSNQNLTSPILTAAILNNISTFNGPLVAQNISASTLTVTGSATLATTTVTALISSTLESASASTTYATVEELFTTRATIANSTTTSAYIVNLFGAGLSTCNTAGDKLMWNNGTFACGVDAGAGGGLTNLNGSTAAGQTFTSTSTGGLILSISTATTTGVHTFAMDLASGYFIPQTASTTDWNTFFNNPTNYLTAGSNVIFSSTSTIGVSLNPIFTSILSASSTFTKAEIANLTVTNATATELFSTLLSAVSAIFTNLQATSATVAILTSGTSTLGNASSSNLTISSSTYFSNNTGIWDANGNLGIGTTSPLASIHIDSPISGASGQELLRLSRMSASSALRLLNFNGTSGTFAFQGTGNLPTWKDLLSFNPNTGNVGVGGSPGVYGRLHVKTSSNASLEGLIVSTPTGDNDGITFRPDAGAGNANPLVQAGDKAIIFSDGAVDTGNLVIGNWSNTSSGIRITNVGNIGIGTSSPLAKLDVWGNFNVATGSNPALFVNTATGNVGIGRNDPVANFDVKASRTNNNIFQVVATDLGPLSSIFSDSSENAWFRLFDTNANENVRLNTSGSSYFTGGNIGIGTTSPSALLHLEHITNPTLRLQDTTNNAYSTITQGDINLVITNNYTGSITFGTNATEYMRLTASGFLALGGETSPDSTLSVKGNAAIGATYAGSNSAPTNGLIVEGNVGIGTTTPLSRLTVTGSDTSNTTAGFSYTNSLGTQKISMTNGGSLVIATTTTDSAGIPLVIGGAAGGSNWARFCRDDATFFCSFLSSNNGAFNSINTGNGFFAWTNGGTYTGGTYSGGTQDMALRGGALLLGTSTNSTAAGGHFGIWGTRGFNNYVSVSSLESPTLGNIFQITNAGKVGIGTTTPSNALETVGDGYFTGTLTVGTNNSSFGSGASGIALTVNGGSLRVMRAGVSDFLITVSQGFTQLYANTNQQLALGANGTEYMRINTSGNASIGTSTPWAKLSIQNDYGSTVDLFDIATTTSAGFATSSLFKVLANGNVGIGTSTPSAKLDINGVARLLGGSYTNPIIPQTVVDASLVMPFGKYIYGEDSGGNVRKLFGMDNSTNLNIGQTGTALIGSIKLQAGNAGYISLIPGGGEALRVTSTGNIGIGTSTPTSKLSVIGSAGVDPFTVSSSTGTRLFNVLANGNVGIGTTSPLSTLDVWGNLNVATGSIPALFVNTASGKIGIGTTSPSAILTLQQANASTNSLLQLVNTSATVASDWRAHIGGAGNFEGYLKLGRGDFGNSFDFAITPTGYTLIGAGKSLALQGSAGIIANENSNTGLYTNSGNGLDVSGLNYVRFDIGLIEKMRVAANGNIGIGTTTPTSLLSIASSTASGATELLSVGTSSSIFSVLANGNVGIGTANPTKSLTVNGAINFLGAGGVARGIIGSPTWDTSYIALQNGSLTESAANAALAQNGSGATTLGAASGQTIAFAINQQVKAVISSNGNVGIGTTSPGTALAIGGNGQISVPDGSSTSPGYTFSSATNTGLYYASGALAWSAGGTLGGTFNNLGLSANGYGIRGVTSALAGGLALGSSGLVTWNGDTGIGRNASGVLEINNGTLGQLRDVQIRSINPVSGNVGIGTTTPVQKLTVAGSIGQFYDNSTNYSIIQRNSGVFGFLGNSGAYFLNYDTTNNRVKIGGGTADAGVNKFGVLGNAAIGSGYISTVAPTDGLIVQGNVGIGTSTPTSLLSLASSTATGTDSLFSISTSTSIFSVLANGNIGIGTSTPAYMFTLGSTGSFKIDSSGNFTAASGIAASFAATNVLQTTNGVLTVSDNQILKLQTGRNYMTSGGGGIQVQAAGGTFSNTSGSSIGMEITPVYNQVGGTGLINTDLLISRTETAIGTSPGSQYLINAGTNNGSFSSQFSVSSLGQGYFAGNVGIGTTTPISLLSIASSTASGESNLFSVSTTSSIFNILANGNIGIGTSTPTKKFQVAGSDGSNFSMTDTGTLAFKSGAFTGVTLTTGNANLLLTGNLATTNGINTGIINQYAVNQDLFIGSSHWSGTTGWNLQIGGDTMLQSINFKNIANSAFVTFDPVTSSVGIGTTTPSARLDVYSSSTQDTLSVRANNGSKWVIDEYGTFRYSTGGLTLGYDSNVGSNAYGSYVDTYITSGLGGAVSKNIIMKPSATGTIQMSGNVGIGTTTPMSKLDIYDATSTSNIDIFRILSDVGSTGNPIFRIDSDGDLFTDGGTTIGNPADVAENYSTQEELLPGTVVAFATTTSPWVLHQNTSTSTTYEMSQIRVAHYGDQAFGIISTRPGILLGGNTASGAPVALSGRVPVMVTNENGVVKRGDYITLSETVPGHAMKMTEAGKSLGRVLSDMTPQSATGTVLVIVEQKDFYPSLSGDEGLAQLESATSTLSTTVPSKSAGQVIEDALRRGSEVVTSFISMKITAVVAYIDTIFTKNLHAENVDTTMLCVGSGTAKTCIDKATLDELLLLRTTSSASASGGAQGSSSSGSNESTTGNGSTTAIIPVETGSSTQVLPDTSSTTPILPDTSTSTPVVDTATTTIP